MLTEQDLEQIRHIVREEFRNDFPEGVTVHLVQQKLMPDQIEDIAKQVARVLMNDVNRSSGLRYYKGNLVF